MYKYRQLKDNFIPVGCSEITEDGQPFIVSDKPLDLSALYLYDLEPVDKSELSENDKLALDDWYGDREIKRWWRESSYEEKLLEKSPVEIERELYGEW